ncbi:MAG TPA: DUF4440 domain-containing protein [Chthonomonadaceae bacterium]|nr:DUF4440 domain-containing protein [Chthonomonadaceae bacterium]
MTVAERRARKGRSRSRGIVMASLLIGLLALGAGACLPAAGQTEVPATGQIGSGPAQSSGPEPQQTPQKPQEDNTAGLRRLAQELAEAVRAGDVNRLLAHYQHSDRLVVIESQSPPRALGWSGYRQEWLRFFHQIRRLDRWTLEDVQAEVTGPAGRLLMRWRMEATTLEGKKTGWEGQMEDAVQKLGNRWVIVRERLWWRPADQHPQGSGGGGKTEPPPAGPGGPMRAGGPGVEGVVLEGPLTPVQRPGVPAERPLANAVVIAQPEGGGREIARVQADGQGRFHLKLAPGSYWLFTQAPPGHIGMSIRKPNRVQVPAGKWVEVTLRLDTGIR